MASPALTAEQATPGLRKLTMMLGGTPHSLPGFMSAVTILRAKGPQKNRLEGGAHIWGFCVGKNCGSNSEVQSHSFMAKIARFWGGCVCAHHHTLMTCEGEKDT